MKKVLSLVMAMCAAATLTAQNAEYATAVHAPQATKADTIKVPCASWKTEQVSGTEYVHVLLDKATEPTYEFQFDCMAWNAKSMVGTFIVSDDPDDTPDDYIDTSNSHVTVYSDGMGDESSVVAGTKVVVTQTVAGYELTAIVVDEFGAIYAITAKQEAKPAAKKTVQLNYTGVAEFWATKSLFGFTAKDKFAEVSATDSIDTHIVIKGNPKTVVGEYAVADFADGNYIAYEGTESKRVTVWDEISASVTADEDYYICQAEIFGSDTILYKITLKAEKPEVIVPKDTVQIEATNLAVSFDEYAELVSFEAKNADGDAVSLTLKTDELYRDYTQEDVKQGSITHKNALHSISLALDVNLTIEEDAAYFPHLTGSVLGNDTVLYVLDLRHAVPEPKKEVNINFKDTGESCFFTRQEYYFMYNADTQYLLAMEVNTDTPEGMYTYYDFNRSYTHIGVINGKDTTDVPMLNCQATITEEDKVYTLEADFLGADSILYHITSTFNYSESEALEYDAVSGSVNRSYTASDHVVLRVEDAENQKVFFRATSLEQADMVALYFYVEDTTQVLIPAGTYDIDDSGAAGTVYACQGIDSEDGMLHPSYYGTLKTSGNLSSVYMLTSGTVTVAYVEDKLTFTLDGKNSNDRPVKIVYDGTKTGLSNTEAPARATKFIRNGVVYIRLNGHTYTTTGVRAE